MTTPRQDEAARDLRAWLGAPGDRVTVVSVEAGQVTLRLDLDPGPVEVVFEVPVGDRKYFLSGPNVGVWYVGETGPEGLEALGALYARVANEAFSALLALCAPAAPPVTQAPRASGPDPAMTLARLTSFFKRPDRSEDWARFVVPERPFLASSVNLPPGSVELQHGTLECLFNDVKSAQVPSLWLFADTRLFNNYDWRFPRYHTNLLEPAILGGTTADHLKKALREVSEKHDPTFLHLATTCLPELIGEDPSDAIAEQRCRCDVLWTAKSHSSKDSIAAWFGARLQAVPAATPAPDTVIVGGVSSPEARVEIERMLGLLGLRAAGHLLPSLDLAEVPRIAEARAVVFGNATGWGAIDDAVFAPRFPVVRPPSPIGEAASVAWLEAVGKALDVDGLEAALDALRADFQERLEPVRREAASVNVALIGNPRELDVLLKSEFYGFPVARCLGDLGFMVRCLVLDDPDAPLPATSAASLGAGSITFEPFRTPDELDGILADGVDIAFSHFTVHPRLAAHGIRSFCQDVFGLGASGLVHAGREILARARGRWAPALRRHLVAGGPR